MQEYAACLAFADYQDTDVFTWGFHLSYTFKIPVYFPDNKDLLC